MIETQKKSESKKQEVALTYRKKFRGLIGVKSKLPVKDSAALSSVYTPGVGEVCLEVQKDLKTSYDYTCRSNTIAIISDGSSYPGMNNVGPYAVLPSLENKSVFHKTFAGIDAYPIPLETQDVDEIVKLIKLVESSFGGFHLEDIAAPKCFEIEKKLNESLSVPFLHVDKEGSGVGILAAIINSSKVLKKEMKSLNVVIAGAGNAAIRTAKMLKLAGIDKVILCDRQGTLHPGRQENMNWAKEEVAKITNPKNIQGKLEEVIKGADVFIGLSTQGVLTREMVESMARDPIVFCLALPKPEMTYNEAVMSGATIICTSLANTPNQINASIVAPGLFRGALDVRASKINEEMLVAAAYAMADVLHDDELSVDKVIPEILDFRISPAIAKAAAEAAIKTGVARMDVDPEVIYSKTLEYVYEGDNATLDPPSKEEFSEDSSIGDKSILMHKRHHGVIEVKAKIPIKDNYIYEVLYSNTAADEPCRLIKEDKDRVYDLTCKNNMIAIVTNGTAVLGLGNIGALAGLPVMEGKAVLFKILGGVEAFPICIESEDIDEIIWATKMMAPVFGGVNLEDIGAPSCFEIEEKLKETTDIIIFHDDQHGTAVVVLAGLINALKFTQKEKDHVKVVVNGAGASALAVSKLLLAYGLKNLTICDTKGAIFKGRTYGMNPYKDAIAENTNPDRVEGKLEDVLKGSDIFIGLSKGNLLTKEMIKTMNPDPIIFALANPYPEIMPKDAYEAGAKIVATGRSDLPNQVNNSIAFPGIFRGALDVKAKAITNDMKIAAAYALSNLIKAEDLSKTNIIPNGLDLRAPVAVAEAVAQSAIDTGIARKIVHPRKIARNLQEHLNEYVELRAFTD